MGTGEFAHICKMLDGLRKVEVKISQIAISKLLVYGPNVECQVPHYMDLAWIIKGIHEIFLV